MFGHGKADNSMWWMMLLCMLPILATLILGSSARQYSWLIFGAVGICIAVHCLGLFKKPKKHHDEQKNNDKHDRHGKGCCH